MLRPFAGTLAFFAVALAAGAARAEMHAVTLNEALALAYKRNANAQIAENQIRRAEALVLEARAGSFPTLIGNAVDTRLDDDRRLQDRILVARDSLAANVTATVPIVVPQRWATWSHAKDNVEVAKVTRTDVRKQLGIAVARAYLAVIVQKRLVEVAQTAFETGKQHYDYSHTRFAGGVGTKIDEVRAAQEVAASEVQMHQAESALQRARDALSLLVSEDGQIDTKEEPTMPELPSTRVALDEAAKNRSDILAQRARLHAAEVASRDAWTDFVPYLVGTAQPFYQNPESLTTPKTGWQAQLLLTIPFYDGGLRYGLERERELAVRDAEVQLAALNRQAHTDVYGAVAQIKRADQSLQAAREAARLARESVDLANTAYRAGATTNLDVIDAERRARDADTQTAVAEDSARQARLELLTASGRFPD